jgi:hypothetical protein
MLKKCQIEFSQNLGNFSYCFDVYKLEWDIVGRGMTNFLGKAMSSLFPRIFNPYVIFVGVVFSCLLIGLSAAAYIIFQPEERVKPAGTALLQVISAPTDTPILPTPLPSQTPTPEPGTPSPPQPGVVNIGAYVQIHGTGNDGLRVRNEPGLQSTVRFVAIEAEVFYVVDGPKDVDGYTWWHLVAPYDETVRGWSVSNYLQVIQQP